MRQRKLRALFCIIIQLTLQQKLLQATIERIYRTHIHVRIRTGTHTLTLTQTQLNSSTIGHAYST